MRVGFDVDDVLADLLTAWLNSYNKEHGTNWTSENLTCWEFQKDLNCSYDDLFKHLQPSLYEVVQPHAGALEVVNAVREMGYEPVFVSSCRDAKTWIAKLKWLVKFGFMSVVKPDIAIPVGKWCEFATKREVGIVFKISVFVDDHIANCEGWPGVAFLLTRPHNQRHLYVGKRLKKLEDLLIELKHWPKQLDPFGVEEVQMDSKFLKNVPYLKADESGWVGDNKIVIEGVNEGIGWATESEKPSNPKDIVGSSKMPFHLFPKVGLIHGTLAMLEGALKYGRSNFDEIGVKASIYADAAVRHLNAYQAGEDRAPDSGLKHLGHAIACCAILLNAEAQGNLVDDRDYKGEAYLKELEKETAEVKRLKEKYKNRLTPRHYTLMDRKEK